MNNNLLIVGAGIYGVVAEEIAESMGCFGKIGFVDDNAKTTPNGIKVVGTTDDLDELACEYSNIIVAIGNPEVRLLLLKRIEETTPFMIATLVSPRAYVSPSAQIMKGSIIEPMAVIHTGSVISVGCIISAGAVINHASMCCDGVHVDCNATVAGMTLVPAGMKIKSGEVFRRDGVKAEDLFLKENLTKATQKPHGPLLVDGMEYKFEDGF